MRELSEGSGPMWDTVTYADLQQAKQQLQLSRDEITRRHAEELQGLDGERDELEALERLVADFARRFKGAPPPAAGREPDGEPAAAPEPDASRAAPEPAVEPEPVAAAPEPAVEPEPAPPPPAAAKPASRSTGRNGDERKYSQTNFDTFRRALSGRL
jgi:hypothetical protein